MSDKLSPLARFIRAYRALDPLLRSMAIDVVRELDREAPTTAAVKPRAAAPTPAAAADKPVVRQRTKTPTPEERRRAAEEAVAAASAVSSPEAGGESMFPVP
jgi:hypothetical protein